MVYSLKIGLVVAVTQPPAFFVRAHDHFDCHCCSVQFRIYSRFFDLCGEYKEKRQYFIASAIAVILGAMGITTLLAEHQSSKKSTVKQVYIGKRGGT